MENKNIMRFNAALYGVNQKIAAVLKKVPNEIKEVTQEIRVRSERPIALTVRGEPLFVKENGQVSQFPNGCFKAEKTDLEECFKLLSKGSVYSRIDQIKSGYIAMEMGCRAGICGTYSKESGISHISSVNIRIAREFLGCADSILKAYKGGGVLIAGPPGSGKTTLLRDFVRSLSNGKNGKFYRVAVVDQRNEISGGEKGSFFNDLGVNTDILLAFEKHTGIENAVRTLYPDFVAFDEIGSKRELLSIYNGLSCGVNIITTAHIGKKQDLLNREITKELLLSKAIKTVIVLGIPAGEKTEILSVQEVFKDCGF